MLVGTMQRAIAALFALELFAALPAAAQDDPFRSTAPSVPRADPFRVVPEQPPVPKPPPTRSREAPEPTAAWDGTWVGPFQCPATAWQQGLSYRVILQVQNNRIVANLEAKSNTPGTIGYDAWSGDIGRDGGVVISRSGVAVGVPGGTPRGQSFDARLQGQFSGDTFVASQIVPSRPCTLNLTRVGARTMPQAVPQPAVSAPPPAAAPPAGLFDGNYAGTRDEAPGGFGGHRHGRMHDCPGHEAVTMAIHGGQVAFQSTGPGGGMNRFAGTVASDGTISAAHTTGDGRTFPLSGTVRGGVYTVSFNFGSCYYTATLTKQ